jgi:hypothetical protein
MTNIPISTFTDMFSAVDPRWDSSYGGAAAVSGRGRIPCTVGAWAALGAVNAAPGDLWTLGDSSVHLEIITLPVGGGATVAYLLLGVMSGTAGTYLSIVYDAVGGYISLNSRIGYADAGAVYLAYDPVVYRWLRMRHTSGVLYWETSPDGLVWTVRRSQDPAPAWVSGAVQILFESSRDGGGDDYAEIDNFNVIPVDALTAAPAAVGTVGYPSVSVFGLQLDADPGVVGLVTPSGDDVFRIPTVPLVSGSAVVRGLAGAAVVRSLSGSATIG